MRSKVVSVEESIQQLLRVIEESPLEKFGQQMAALDTRRLTSAAALRTNQLQALGKYIGTTQAVQIATALFQQLMLELFTSQASPIVASLSRIFEIQEHKYKALKVPYHTDVKLLLETHVRILKRRLDEYAAVHTPNDTVTKYAMQAYLDKSRYMQDILSKGLIESFLQHQMFSLELGREAFTLFQELMNEDLSELASLQDNVYNTGKLLLNPLSAKKISASEGSRLTIAMQFVMYMLEIRFNTVPPRHEDASEDASTEFYNALGQAVPSSINAFKVVQICSRVNFIIPMVLTLFGEPLSFVNHLMEIVKSPELQKSIMSLIFEEIAEIPEFLSLMIQSTQVYLDSHSDIESTKDLEEILEEYRDVALEARVSAIGFWGACPVVRSQAGSETICSMM